jgi:hypothetical protein
MEGLTIVIPRDGKQVEVGVDKEKFYCPDGKLAKVLKYVMLDTGHHADKDLELAQLAVRKLGGKVVDNRGSNNAKHGIPK